MLVLTNNERKHLRQAIVTAYPAPGDLEIFVDEALNQNLAAIAGGSNLNQTAHKLIQWAVAKGHTDALIMQLAQDTQNPDIQQICSRVLQQYLSLNANDGVGPLPSMGQAAWDVNYEELQSFLPKRFSFEADVGELQRGLELSKSVCKVTFADRSADECGTGVLIAPDLMLTNYHVFSREAGADLDEIATQMRCEFGYTSAQSGNQAYVCGAVENQAVVSASPINVLDYVLVRLRSKDDSANEKSIQPVAYNSTDQLTPRSPLNILQHPEGEQMKVSLSNNGVVKTDEARGLVLYVNAARPGSSGSPCFNQQWQLVALHHKGLATSFGSVREGILFSAIYPEIQSFLPKL